MCKAPVIMNIETKHRRLQSPELAESEGGVSSWGRAIRYKCRFLLSPSCHAKANSLV